MLFHIFIIFSRIVFLLDLNWRLKFIAPGKHATLDVPGDHQDCSSKFDNFLVMASALYGCSIRKVHGHSLEDFKASSFLCSFELIGVVFNKLRVNEILFIGPDSTDTVLFFGLFMYPGDDFLVDIGNKGSSRVVFVKDKLSVHS